MSGIWAKQWNLGDKDEFEYVFRIDNNYFCKTFEEPIKLIENDWLIIDENKFYRVCGDINFKKYYPLFSPFFSIS